MAVLAGEDRVVEAEVLGAGLGQHRYAAVLRRAHEVGTFAGRHVDDVQLSAGDLAPVDGALDGLGFDEVGPRHGVELRTVLLHQFRRVVTRDQLVEHAGTLGVHQQHGAQLAHGLERAEHRSVVALPAFRLIDHELFECRETAIHHPGDLVLVLVPARDADVEGVVD